MSHHIFFEDTVLTSPDNDRASRYIEDPKEARHWFAETFRLVANGTLKVLVHKEFPLTAEGVRESQKEMQDRTSVGKLLIKVA